MRPHDRRASRKTARRETVRQLLRAKAGWLRGYPLARQGALGWRMSAAVGSSRPAETIILTSDHLRRAARAARDLRRESPAGLAALVGDLERWQRGLDALLAALGAALRRQQLLPDVDAVLSASHSPRTLRGLAELRDRQPALGPVLEALAWIHALDEDGLSASLRVVAAHVTTFAKLVAGDTPRSRDLALQLVALGVADGAKRIAPLLEDVANPDAHGVPLCGVREAPEVLAELAEGKKATWPQRPKVELGPSLIELTGFLHQQDDDTRRRGLALWALLRPGEQIPIWARWWQRQDRGVKRAQGALARLARGTRSLWEVRQEHAELKATVQNIPAEVRATELCRAVRQLASRHPIGRRTLLAALEALPEMAAGKLVRIPLAVLWAHAIDEADYPAKLCSCLLAETRRYQQRWAGTPAQLAPWRSYLEGDGHQRPWGSIDHQLLRTESEATITRFFDALHRGVERAGDRAIDLWSERSRLSLLCRIAELVPSGEVAERLLERLSAAGVLADNTYLTEAALRAGLALCRDDDSQLGEVVAALEAADIDDISLDEDDPLGLARTCADPECARLLRAAVLRNQVRWLQGLGGRLRLLQAFGASAPELELSTSGRTPGWARRYPPSLRPWLTRLASVDPEAERTVEPLLGAIWPSPEALIAEMSAIESRLASSSGEPARRLRKRLENLQGRLARARSLGSGEELSPARLAKLTDKLRLLLERRTLDRWQQRLDAAIAEALPRALDLDALPSWALEGWVVALMGQLAGLDGPSRRLALKLLRIRAGPYPWDLRDEPANRRFLDGLRERGVDPRPWLEGVGIVRGDPPKGAVFLQLERDPLEVLLMGKHFDTCLSPGWFNFFSAVSNAADVNKRVLYARDEGGGVVGRCLLALTDEGRILTFHPYCHDEAGYTFRALAKRFVERLAEQMGTTTVTWGSISKLLCRAWYDDGPVDVTGRYAIFDHDSELCQWLTTVPVAELRSGLAEHLGPLPLDAVTLPMLLALPAMQKRPELGCQLLDEVDRCRELPLPAKAEMALLAWRAGEREAARALVERSVLAKVERWSSRQRALSPFILEMLIDMDQPSLVLRLLERTRPRGVRRWRDEYDPQRIFVAARAHLALHRRKLAHSLFEQTAARCDRLPDLRRRCQEQLAAS